MSDEQQRTSRIRQSQVGTVAVGVVRLVGPARGGPDRLPLRALPTDRIRNRQKLGSRGGLPPKFDKLAVRYETTVLVAVLNGWL